MARDSSQGNTINWASVFDSEESPLNQSDLEEITEILTGKGPDITDFITTLLSFLPSTSIHELLHDFVNDLKASPHETKDDQLQHFLLLLSRELLSQQAEPLTNKINAFKNGSMSEYRLGYWIDAVTTLAIVYERLNDFTRAVSSLLGILQHMCGISLDESSPSNAEAISFSLLPESCRKRAVLSVSRLVSLCHRSRTHFPQLEGVLDLFTAPVSPLRAAAPAFLTAGLMVEKALQEIRAGKDTGAPLSFYLSNTNEATSENQSLRHLEVASSMLEKVKGLFPITPETAEETFRNRSTVLRALEGFIGQASSDPMKYHAMASPGFIAAVLVGIWKHKGSVHGTRFDTEVLSVLEWANIHDVAGDVNILSNLSSAYDRLGDTERARNLLKRCNSEILRNAQAKDNTFDSLREAYHSNISLLYWMGVELQASELLWLPAVKYMEISLRAEGLNAEKVDAAIAVGRASLEGLFGEPAKNWLAAVHRPVSGIDLIASDDTTSRQGTAPDTYSALLPTDILMNGGLESLYINFPRESTLVPTAQTIASSFLQQTKSTSKKEAKQLAQFLSETKQLLNEDGAYTMLFFLGKAYQMRAREASVRDRERQQVQMQALRIFAALSEEGAAAATGRLLGALTTSLPVHHAVALADLRFYRAATAFIKQALTESPSQVPPPLPLPLYRCNSMLRCLSQRTPRFD